MASLVVGLVFGAVVGALTTASVMGRYYVNGKASSFILVDRFTGELQWCSLGECEPIKKKVLSPQSWDINPMRWYKEAYDYVADNPTNGNSDNFFSKFDDGEGEIAISPLTKTSEEASAEFDRFWRGRYCKNRPEPLPNVARVASVRDGSDAC